MPNINEEELWPWEYTTEEGGNFVLWKKGSITREQLAELVIYYKKWHHKIATIDNINVHSLIFESCIAGFDNYARWDCLNGWTTTIEEAKKKWPEGLHGQLPSWRIGNSTNVLV